VVPAPAAILSAVEDALSPFGVRVTRTPLFPAEIVALIEKRDVVRRDVV
jgi:carbon-monoxide dehydrogenase large subunit